MKFCCAIELRTKIARNSLSSATPIRYATLSDAPSSHPSAGRTVSCRLLPTEPNAKLAFGGAVGGKAVPLLSHDDAAPEYASSIATSTAPSSACPAEKHATRTDSSALSLVGHTKLSNTGYTVAPANARAAYSTSPALAYSPSRLASSHRRWLAFIVSMFIELGSL
jgi:hypothetical protein